MAAAKAILICAASLQRFFVSLRPFSVEETFFVRTLVGVGTEVVTLRLGEVLGQASASVAVK
jgi:hypothetical protein